MNKLIFPVDISSCFTQLMIVSLVLGDTIITDQSERAGEAPSTQVSDVPARLQTPRAKGGKKHRFISKTVKKKKKSSETIILLFKT